MAVPATILIRNVVRGFIMNCNMTKECACPKTTCPNHKKCCVCVIKHKETDSLPYCLFLDNDGDKSLENLYRKLKERFEK